MDSIQPTPDCKDMDHRQEVAFQFFISGGQPSHILHPAKEPLHEVSLCMDIGVMRDMDTGV